MGIVCELFLLVYLVADREFNSSLILLLSLVLDSLALGQSCKSLISLLDLNLDQFELVPRDGRCFHCDYIELFHFC